MNLTKHNLTLLGVAVFYAISLANLSAQSTFGTINGVISDPSSAVVDHVTVKVTNEGTGSERTSFSDKDGFYRVVNLDAGTYTIEVTANGFNIEKKEHIPLLAREIDTIDFKLTLASGKEQIEVTSEAPVIEDSLTISDSKSGEQISDLALNFRASNAPSPIVVANLTPGAQPDPNGNISISGGLPNSTSFTLDGVSTQEVRFGGPNTDLFPSVESIAEFRVNTAGNDAEYSQPSDLTVISKSGSNEYHGSGFWYFQRGALNAKDPFAVTKPALQADDFGATLGGPFSIPKVYDGRNKSFFFFTYEGVRRPDQIVLNEIVPAAAWRTGDMSSVTTPIIDPFTGAPFPNNQIPVNPVSAKILQALFVLPNGSGPNSTSYTTNFPGNYSVDGFDGRFDQNFGNSNKAFFRVTQKNITAVGDAGDPEYDTLQGPNTTATALTNLAGSLNTVFKPNLINEFRGGYTFADYKANQYPLAAQGEALVQSFGITGLPGPPVNGLGGISNFAISGFLGDETTEGHPRDIKNGVLDFEDIVTWIKGSHSIKGGFEFRRVNYQDQITFLQGDEYGDYFFTGAVTGNAFADFLLGLPAAAAYAQNGPDGKPYGYHYGGFIQDDWRVNRKFTLSFGIRYEVNPPYNDETHQLGQFLPNVKGGELVVQGAVGLSLVSPSWKAEVGNTPFETNTQAGLPIGLRYTWYGNYQPRLGAAWNVDNKTVIHAFGGLFSVPVMGAVNYSLLGVDTSNFVEFVTSPTNPLVLPNVFSGSSASLGYPGYRRANQLNLQDPQVAQWNFTIDRDLGWNTLLRIAYTGSHTWDLLYSPDLNQLEPNTVGYAALTATPALRQENLLYPNFAEVLTRANGPWANYNAGTIELKRRFAHGLTFDNSYVYTRSLTNGLGSAPNSDSPNGEGSSGRGDNGENVLNKFDIGADYGNSPYNRRNRFVSTFVYELPFGRGKKIGGNISRAADLAIGGWRLTGITLLQTGPFLTPTYSGSTDPSGTDPGQRSEGSFERPDCVGGNPNDYAHSVNGWWNPASFAVPANLIGRFGNCGVGILTGPGTKTFSASLGKDFHLGERVSLRYEIQASNLFNITNYAAPNTQIDGGNFGQITATQSGDQAGPRTIQMVLRFLF
jgi:hypothetical protein